MTAKNVEELKITGPCAWNFDQIKAYNSALKKVEEMLIGKIEEILLDLWTAHEDHTHSEIHNTLEIQAAYKGRVWYYEGQLLTCLNLLKEKSAIDVLGIERYEELREEWSAKKEELRKKLMFPFEENTEVTITFRSQ